MSTTNGIPGFILHPASLRFSNRLEGRVAATESSWSIHLSHAIARHHAEEIAHLTNTILRSLVGAASTSFRAFSPPDRSGLSMFVDTHVVFFARFLCCRPERVLQVLSTQRCDGNLRKRKKGKKWQRVLFCQGSSVRDREMASSPPILVSTQKKCHNNKTSPYYAAPGNAQIQKNTHTKIKRCRSIGSFPELCIYFAFGCISFHLHYICFAFRIAPRISIFALHFISI